jgi:hypothetical protein
VLMSGLTFLTVTSRPPGFNIFKACIMCLISSAFADGGFITMRSNVPRSPVHSNQVLSGRPLSLTLWWLAKARFQNLNDGIGVGLLDLHLKSVPPHFR